MKSSPKLDTLISVDPSYTCTGLAKFCGARLIQVDTCAPKNTYDLVESIANFRWRNKGSADCMPVVCEFPQIYNARTSRADPNDMLKIAALAGGAMAYRSDSVAVTPAEWKGQETKEITERRVRERLSNKELLIVEQYLETLAKRLHNNVWDAVGIGLWACGRYDKRRVYAR